MEGAAPAVGIQVTQGSLLFSQLRVSLLSTVLS